MTASYCKIVLAARMRAGEATPALRVKSALEAQGHTVFLFTPRMWPGLFDDASRFKADMLARFFEVQRPDCLVVAEGLGASGLDIAAAHGVACGMLAATRAEAESSVAASEGAPFDFAIALSGRSMQLEDIDGFDGAVGICAPMPDEGYVRTPLANLVAFGPGVMCVQDATPERIAFFDALAADKRFAGSAIRCFGEGWPERFASDPSFTHLVYSSRSSAACVVFDEAAGVAQLAPVSADADERDVDAAELPADASALPAEEACDAGDPNEMRALASSDAIRLAPVDALLTDEELVLMRADGVALVGVGEVRSPWRAERMDELCAEEDAARDVLVRLVADAREACEPFESRKVPACDEGLFLEGALAAALSSVREALAERGLMGGLPAPRTVVSALGYVGMGNFGDEYILATVDRRLRETVCGSTLIAVGENPLHTLTERGIYSITLADKHVLDCVLGASSAALVLAGLLFDQGIRWSIGKAEVVSSMPHTDIAGIAAYTELAYLNDARPIFYGIGAGPLDVSAGRDLVRLMGRLGALFITRDEATADLIRACRVRGDQIASRADIAFLGHVEQTVFVDEWLEHEGIDPAKQRIVAVSLREYENAPSDFANRVASALSKTAAAHSDVVFAACVLDQDDVALAKRIAALLPKQVRLHIFNAGEQIAPVADFLSRCAAGFSMRYHCSLLLGSFCKPCVGLGYLPKVVSLYEDLGQDSTLLSMDASAAQIEECLNAVLSFGAQRAFALTNRVTELRQMSADAENILLDGISSIASAKSGPLPSEFFLNAKTGEAQEIDRLRDEVASERERADAACVERSAAYAARDAARAEVEEYAHSYSYRVGSTLLTLPRKLREALSKGAKGPKES